MPVQLEARMGVCYAQRVISAIAFFIRNVFRALQGSAAKSLASNTYPVPEKGRITVNPPFDGACKIRRTSVGFIYTSTPGTLSTDGDSARGPRPYDMPSN